MAFNYEYPYTDATRYNSDWVLNKVKELEGKIVGLEDSILEKAKVYIDEQLEDYKQEVRDLRREFEEFKVEVAENQEAFESTINSQFNTYKSEVNNILTVFEGRIDALNTKLDNSITAVNLRTDNAIAQNNDFIFTEIGKYISRDIKVRNLFTGEQVSLQDMFDYLANLHTTGAITIDEIDDADKTVTEMIAYDETITNFVINGKAIIV